MRFFLASIGISLLFLSSCSQKRICPAYQSSFIYDKEALRKKFSYFDADSNPRVFLAASKNKYLIAVPESYRKKYQRLQTIEMKPIYPVKVDSVGDNIDSLKANLIASAVTDSIQGTSLVDESGFVQKSLDFKITQTKEKYNNDQDYYMWFFRKILILPDIKYHLDKKSTGEEIQENFIPKKNTQDKNKKVNSRATRSKGITPFQNLKNPIDSVKQKN